MERKRKVEVFLTLRFPPDMTGLLFFALFALRGEKNLTAKTPRTQ
jgi:hypothetical protein